MEHPKSATLDAVEPSMAKRVLPEMRKLEPDFTWFEEYDRKMRLSFIGVRSRKPLIPFTVTQLWTELCCVVRDIQGAKS